MNIPIVLREATHNDRDELQEMVLAIQQREFGFSITVHDQPDLQDPVGFFSRGNGCFVVAEANGRIVGCGGLQDCGDGIAQLRKMFVCREYRGKQLGIAGRILARLVAHAYNHRFRSICLGTCSALRRAMRFYVQAGFEELPVEELPRGVRVALVDDRAYCLHLENPPVVTPMPCPEAGVEGRTLEPPFGIGSRDAA